MKIPLDYICVRTGVLCPRCRRLVESGAVKDYEINVMKYLLELEDKPEFRFLKDSKYIRSFKIDNMLILLLEIPGSIQSRVLARLSRVLFEKLKIKVRVINKARGNLRDIASQLMYPARVIGVNTLWLPDGTIEHIVRVPKSDRRYLPLDMMTLENVLSQITGVNVKIRVEG